MTSHRPSFSNNGSNGPRGTPLLKGGKEDSVDPWLLAVEAKVRQAQKNIQELWECDEPAFAKSEHRPSVDRRDSQTNGVSFGDGPTSSSPKPTNSTNWHDPRRPFPGSTGTAVASDLSPAEIRLQIDEIFVEAVSELREAWREMREAERAASAPPPRAAAPVSADQKDQQIAVLQAAVEKQTKQLADQRAAYYKELLLLREQLSMKDGRRNYNPEDWGRFFEPEEELTPAQLLERLDEGRGPKTFQAAYQLIKQRYRDMSGAREGQIEQQLQECNAAIQEQRDAIQRLKAAYAEKEEEMRKLEGISQAELMQHCYALSNSDLRTVEQSVWRLSDVCRDEASRFYKVPASALAMMIGFMQKAVGAMSEGLQRERYLDELQDKLRRLQNSRQEASTTAKQEAERLRNQVGMLVDRLDAFARAVAEFERLKTEASGKLRMEKENIERRKLIEQMSEKMQSEVSDLHGQLRSFSNSMGEIERLHSENATLRSSASQTAEELKKLRVENKLLASKLKRTVEPTSPTHRGERLPSPLGRSRPGTAASIWEYEFDAPDFPTYLPRPSDKSPKEWREKIMPHLPPPTSVTIPNIFKNLTSSH